MFGIHQHLRVVNVADAQEAIDNGYDYKDKGFKPLQIETAVIVRKGTVEGNPTVDLLMVDQEGNKYALMITGNLLKMLPL